MVDKPSVGSKPPPIPLWVTKPSAWEKVSNIRRGLASTHGLSQTPQRKGEGEKRFLESRLYCFATVGGYCRGCLACLLADSNVPGPRQARISRSWLQTSQDHLQRLRAPLHWTKTLGFGAGWWRFQETGETGQVKLAESASKRTNSEEAALSPGCWYGRGTE